MNEQWFKCEYCQGTYKGNSNECPSCGARANSWIHPVEELDSMLYSYGSSAYANHINVWAMPVSTCSEVITYRIIQK